MQGISISGRLPWEDPGRGPMPRRDIRSHTPQGASSEARTTPQQTRKVQPPRARVPVAAQPAGGPIHVLHENLQDPKATGSRLNQMTALKYSALADHWATMQAMVWRPSPASKVCKDATRKAHLASWHALGHASPGYATREAHSRASTAHLDAEAAHTRAAEAEGPESLHHRIAAWHRDMAQYHREQREALVKPPSPPRR